MRFFICLLLLNFCSAQTFQITEISSKKVGDQLEWFEFRVDEGTDLTGYQVSNGTTKRPLTGTMGAVGYYMVSPSPVGLADKGGVIQILNVNDAVVHESLYPKTKGGTRKAYKWAEIWNWSPDFERFIPMIYHNDQDPMYAITPGAINHHLPTPADRFELKIEQVDFVNNTIALRMHHGPKKINLKHISIKHNGTILWSSPGDFWLNREAQIVLKVGTEEFQQYETTIHTPKRASVQQSSGSIEVVLHTGTSWEQIADFACWQEEELNKTETNRAEKYRVQRVWSGPCIEVATVMGIARAGDSNQASDFTPISISEEVVLPTEKESDTQDLVALMLADESFVAAVESYVPPQKKAPVSITSEVMKSDRKIILPKTVRQRLKRNIGLIWNWREARWAAAVGSISDGAIDRNSERFLVKFGAP